MTKFSRESVGVFKIGDQLNTGRGIYKIYKVVSGGGRGQTYLAKVMQVPPGLDPELRKKIRKSTDVIVKTVRIDGTRSSWDTANFIRAVDSTLQAEYNALHKLRGLNCVAKTFDTGVHQIKLEDGTCVAPRYIVQEFIEGERLDLYLEKKWSGDDEKFRGIPSACDWFALATALVISIKQIHQRGVCHKDIWLNNIMMKGDKAVFIDFGESAFRQATSVSPVYIPLSPHEFMAPECRLGDRWPSRRADLYSVGGVLYYLATGQKPDLILSEDNDQLKRSVTEMIRQNNSSLLAENCGIPDVIARCLRFNRQQRVRNAEALLEELRTFDLRPPYSFTRETLARINHLVRLLCGREPNLFTDIVGIELGRMESRLEDILHGVLDINGDHEEIVFGLKQFLSVLREGDEYLTLTIPRFWSPGNLGINGRYLAMTKLIAERGVKVCRVFLLTKDEKNDKEAREILRAHYELSESLSLDNKHMMEIRYLEMTEERRKKAVEIGNHYGVCIHQDSGMKVIPVYDDGVLTSVRLRYLDESVENARRRFAKYFDQACDLNLLFSPDTRPLRLTGDRTKLMVENREANL
jgi:serine/threonine protein kinase